MTLSTKLRSRVAIDPITAEISRMMDYSFDGESTFTPHALPDVPPDYGVGLIVGGSGSGKSTLLTNFGVTDTPVWRSGEAVVSHFASAAEASTKLSAVGFNTVPAWLRPYHVLSTGEKFRADVARVLGHGAVIDEFTSVVDRDVAKSCAHALARYAREAELRRVTLASCHRDIIPWLDPDWVFDTDTGQLAGRGSGRRPVVKLQVSPCAPQEWARFRDHHYLSGDINKSSRCWLVSWGSVLVGFTSALAFPNGNFSNAWRGHRTVVLPEFQGMGFGVRISDAIGEIFLAHGCRYFSKTAHPRFGGYRNASPLWRGTSKNGRARHDYSAANKTKEDKHKMRHAARLCYSHEYIGADDAV